MTREEFNRFIGSDIFGMCGTCKHVKKSENKFGWDNCNDGWCGDYEPCLHFEVSDKAWSEYSKPSPSKEQYNALLEGSLSDALRISELEATFDLACRELADNEFDDNGTPEAAEHYDFLLNEWKQKFIQLARSSHDK